MLRAPKRDCPEVKLLKANLNCSSVVHFSLGLCLNRLGIYPRAPSVIPWRCLRYKLRRCRASMLVVFLPSRPLSEAASSQQMGGVWVRGEIWVYILPTKWAAFKHTGFQMWLKVQVASKPEENNLSVSVKSLPFQRLYWLLRPSQNERCFAWLSVFTLTGSTVSCLALGMLATWLRHAPDSEAFLPNWNVLQFKCRE